MLDLAFKPSGTGLSAIFRKMLGIADQLSRDRKTLSIPDEITSWFDLEKPRCNARCWFGNREDISFQVLNTFWEFGWCSDPAALDVKHKV
jgi:hypothetical protein